ncbi:MAG: NifU family protein [Aquificae bacterium]|jgi:Fe-S cluster biogenesis protein NfuA|nr:NifU family protein [Aquificota bacterium]
MGEVLSKEQMVKEFIESVKPALLRHEGDVRLEKIDNNVVYLKFIGSCVDCDVRPQAMFPMLKMMLMNKFPWVKDVVDLTV